SRSTATLIGDESLSGRPMRRVTGPLSQMGARIGNAGTGMRCWPACWRASRSTATLIGDESLSGRPMRRVTGPLSQMGARI
ncbi:hypothetical protein C7E18_23335, partial [Stenotrophomonas maltophilia]